MKTIWENKGTFVLGGTQYDVGIGYEILLKKGFKVGTLFISDDPYIQSNIQTNNVKDLEKKVVKELIKYSPSSIFVFCNSLSFSIDWNKIALKTACKIYDLRKAYNLLLSTKKSISLLTADSITLHRISTYLKKINPQLEVYGFAMLPLVDMVEKQNNYVIDILHYLFKLSKDLSVDAFVLGCTHFEKYYPLEFSDLNIIYPGRYLIDQLIDTSTHK